MLELNGTILAVILNFIILVWILKAFLYGPILKVLNDRKAKIEADLWSASESSANAAALKAQYEESLKNAKREAQEIVKKAVEVGDKIKQETIEAAKIDSGYIRKKAHEDADRVKGEAYAGAKSDIADLVMLTAGKLLKKTIDSNAHKDLIDESIARIGKERLN